MYPCSEIVLVNQSTGYLMVDIVNAYAETYKKVILIAGTVKTHERQLSNVQVDKIIKYNKKNIFSRCSTWLISTIQIYFKILFKYRKAYIIYVTNPPISYFCSRLLRNKFSIIVYDIYPEALKNIGISDSSFIFKFWQRQNRKIFQKVDYVFTLSEGMKRLLSSSANEHKIKVIPNWSSNTFIQINRADNPFIAEHTLENKFVIMYSGNIGHTHNVEIIIDLAIKLQYDPEIEFVIIGDGGKKTQLIEMAKSSHLSNCLFLDWLPADQLVYSLNAADLSVITLTEETAFVSVPSKTYNLLSVGSPLLCIAPHRSEIGILVNEENCGKCFEKKEIDDMVEYILRIKNDFQYKEILIQNSLAASQKYTFKNAQKYVI